MNVFRRLRRLSIVVASMASLTVISTQVAEAVACDAAWRVQPSTAFPSGAVLNDVAVTGTGETWVVGTAGDRGLLGRLANGTWTTSRYSVPGQLVSLSSVDAQPGIAWAVGRTQADVFDPGSPIVLVNDGGGWRRQALPAGLASAGLSSVVIRSRDDVWLSGGLGDHPLAVHWNGSRMTATALPFSGTAEAIEAPPDGGVVMVGLSYSPYSFTAWHWNGYRWNQDRVPPAFGEEFFAFAVDGTRTYTWALVTAVGGCCSTFASVYRWNGSRWTADTPETGGSLLRDILVSRGDGQVVVVGESPCGGGCENVTHAQVWQRTGSRWIERPIVGLTTTTHSGLVAIDGDGNAGRWAVGTFDSHPLLIRQCASTA